ncbi:thioredoxin domain-containing protein [Candidatus Saccharibacteria bacterium]|nr:thioredoxin domain-containing protein [Candidatus Saccharibacteria bacterium]
MKSRFGFSKIAILAIIAGAGLLTAMITLALVHKKANEVDYDKYDANVVIEGTEDNGNIPDHIKGSADAPVKIFEYADYQCPGCATTNPRLNKLIEEYDGKLAVVYRNFLLSYHQNGTAAASAAEAAGLQGYWKPYADKLFANQSSWEYADASDRTDIFVDYFEKVSDGKGDVAKFKADMGSAEVKKKIDFDMGLGRKVDVPGTPALYIDGEWIDFSNHGTEEKFYELLRQKIDAKLNAEQEA